jgi:hypothetical protein
MFIQIGMGHKLFRFLAQKNLKKKVMKIHHLKSQ